MAFEEINVTTKPVNRRTVREMLEMQPPPGERKLNPKRVERLRAKLDKGLFFGPTWAFAQVGKSREKIRVNGQHSAIMLDAAIDDGVSINGLEAKVIEFHCDTLHDVAALFAQFDDRRSARSETEIVNVYSSQSAELADIAPSAVRNCLYGIAWVNRFVHDIPSQGIEEHLEKFLESNTEFIRFCTPFIFDKSLRRIGTLAAMYRTWELNRDEAENFWPLVLDESHPDNRHPSRMLARKLRVNYDAKVLRSTASTLALTTRRLYCEAIHCWNSYMKGRTMDKLPKYIPRAKSLPRVLDKKVG